ncbi:MAG: sugar phosphate isomerase/epimerase, partial [Bacteroidia bacterium]
MKRRTFLKDTSWGAAGTLLLPGLLAACSTGNKESEQTAQTASKMKELNLSLAQWSLHKKFFDKELNPN